MSLRLSQIPAKKRGRGRQPQEIAVNMDGIALFAAIEQSLDHVIENDVGCEDEGYGPEIEDLKLLRKEISHARIEKQELLRRLGGVIQRLELTLDQDKKDDQITRAAIQKAIAGIQTLRGRNVELETEAEA